MESGRSYPVGSVVAAALALSTRFVHGGLTTVMLWSLGQAIVVTPEETDAFQAVATSRG